jgi:hypothetical protein
MREAGRLTCNDIDLPIALSEQNGGFVLRSSATISAMFGGYPGAAQFPLGQRKASSCDFGIADI